MWAAPSSGLCCLVMPVPRFLMGDVIPLPGPCNTPEVATDGSARRELGSSTRSPGHTRAANTSCSFSQKTHLSVFSSCSLTKLCSVCASSEKKTCPHINKLSHLPVGQETPGELLTVGWVKSTPFAYTWEHRKQFIWEQLNVNKRFGINALLTSSPAWIILWSYLWWKGPWINESLARLKKTVQSF